MWQSRTHKLGLLCIAVQMTYESEHVRIGYWHRKTKHMNNNLSNVTVQHLLWNVLVMNPEFKYITRYGMILVQKQKL